MAERSAGAAWGWDEAVRWTVPAAMARAVEVLRDEGARSLLFRALGELGYRRLLLLERPLAAPPPRLEPRVAASVGSLEDPREHLDYRPDVPLEAVVARLAGGESCCVARVGGRIVAATWACRGGGAVRYLGARLELPEPDVYLSDTLVLPGWRGRGLAPAIAAEQIRLHRDAGCRRLVSAVLPENAESLRARAKAGFRPAGVIGSLGAGRWRHLFVREPAASGVGLWRLDS